MRKAPLFSAPRVLALLLALLVSSGCAPWPQLDDDEIVATRPLDSQAREALLEDAWSVAPGVYRARFSALYNYRGFEMPLAGVAEVDTLESRVHMVGLTDTGLRLFDVESRGGATQEALKVNFLVEVLLKLPDFAGTVGRGAQRVFLGPSPERGGTLEQLPDRYILRAEGLDGAVEYVLAGDGRLLAKKSISPMSPVEGGKVWRWRVRYAEHADATTAPFPAQAVYSDDETGATLRLKINSVRLTQ